MSLTGQMDGRRFLRTLGRLGWKVIRQRGSHRRLEHVSGRRITIAFHRTVGRPTVKRTLEDAGIDEAEFVQALL